MAHPTPTASALHTAANAIRILAVDAVARAKSGHQGMPMGMAEIAVALWAKHLRHNPANPHWANRDRFVVSNGHGSMLPYALLHLSGYALSMDDIKQFRQLHSKTPGHPEVGVTPGIETTTGPLGQGIANAVGMALAEKLLAKQYGNAANTKWMPGYVRWDAMVSYAINKNVSLQLNVQNLADKLYFTKAYASHYAAIAPGRSATLTAQFKF